MNDGDEIVRGANQAPNTGVVVKLKGGPNCYVFVWNGTGPGDTNEGWYSMQEGVDPVWRKVGGNTVATTVSRPVGLGKVAFESRDTAGESAFIIFTDPKADLGPQDGWNAVRIYQMDNNNQMNYVRSYSFAIVDANANADPTKNTNGNNVVLTGNPGGRGSGEACSSNKDCQSGLCQGGICMDDCVYNYGGPTDDPQTDRTFQYVDKADWDRGVWQDCYSTFVEPVGGAESDVYKVTDFQCDRTLGQTCAVVAGHAGDPQCAVCSTVKATGSSPTSSSSSSVTSCSDPGDVCRLSSENLPCADSLQKNPSTCYKGGQLGKCYACGNGTASNGGSSSASSVAKASSGPIQGTCTMFVVHQPGLVTQLLMSFLNTCMTQTQQSCEAAQGAYVGQKCAYSSLFPFNGSAVLQTGNCPFTCTLP